MRQSFFYFVIEGDNLDVIAAKDAIGLPCEIYTKGQKSITRLGQEVVSKATRWFYRSERIGRADVLLAEQLKIIADKLPVLKDYIKNYKTKIELVIYEDRPGEDTIKLSKKVIKLLDEIDVKLIIAFK